MLKVLAPEARTDAQRQRLSALLPGATPDTVFACLPALDQQEQRGYLTALCQHPEPAVRVEALAAFERLGGADAVPALQRALTEDDPRVLATAVRGMAALRPPNLAQMLLGLLQDPDRPNASRALLVTGLAPRRLLTRGGVLAVGGPPAS